MCHIAAAVFAYGELFLPIARDGVYAPFWTDEYGYLTDAKSVVENGTVHRVRLLEEHAARFGQAGGHGFAYSLVHGAVLAIGDNHPVSLIVANVLAILGAVGLVLASRMELLKRLAIVALVLSYPVVLRYVFTFMVEPYQVLFAVMGALFMLQLYEVENDSRSFRLMRAGFVGLLLVLSVFRITYALWTLALIPVSRSRAELARSLVIVAVCMVSGFLFQLFFAASYPYGFLANVRQTVAEGDGLSVVALIVEKIWVNVTRYFLAPHIDLSLVFKHAIFFSAVAALIYGLVKRQRLLVAAGLIGAAHFFFLFTLYDAYDWREHRMLAPAMYMLIITFVYAGNVRVVGAIYVLLTLLFPQTYEVVDNRLIPDRRSTGIEYETNSEECAAFGRLALKLDGGDGEIITVLYANAFFGDGQLFYLCLPLRSAGGVPVRYTTSLKGDGLGMWDRLRIDYVMTQTPLDDSAHTLVHEEDTYLLYRASQ